MRERYYKREAYSLRGGMSCRPPRSIRPPGEHTPGSSARAARRGVLSFPWIALACACVTVPAGHSAVVTTPSGVRTTPLGEGLSFIGPWSQADVFDLRAQERNENLRGLAADGAPVEANASVVTWHLVPEELVAFDRTVGPHPYQRIIRPIVQAAVRRVVARYPAFELMDTRNLPAIQKEITEMAARDVRPMHIELDAVILRSLVVTSESLAAAIVDTSRMEQRVLTMQHDLEIARGQADVLREQGRSQAATNAALAPTLTPEAIADAEQRAWARLLVSPNTLVIFSPEVSPWLEVEP